MSHIHYLTLSTLFLHLALMSMTKGSPISLETKESILAQLSKRRYSHLAYFWNEGKKSFVAYYLNHQTQRYEKTPKVPESTHQNTSVATQTKCSTSPCSSQENSLCEKLLITGAGLTQQSQRHHDWFAQFCIAAAQSSSICKPLRLHAITHLYTLAHTYKNLPALSYLIPFYKHRLSKFSCSTAHENSYIRAHQLCQTVADLILSLQAEHEKLMLDTAQLVEIIQAQTLVPSLHHDAALIHALLTYHLGVQNQEEWMIDDACNRFTHIDSPLAQLYATAITLMKRELPQHLKGELFEYLTTQLNYLEKTVDETSAFRGFEVFQKDLELIGSCGGNIGEHALHLLTILAQGSHADQKCIDSYKKQLKSVQEKNLSHYRPELSLGTISYTQGTDFRSYLEKLNAVITTIPQDSDSVKHYFLDHLLKTITPDLPHILQTATAEDITLLTSLVFRKLHPRIDQIDQFFKACIAVFETSMNTVSEKTGACLFNTINTLNNSIKNLASYKILYGYVFIPHILQKNEPQIDKSLDELYKWLMNIPTEMEDPLLNIQAQTLKLTHAGYYQWHATTCPDIDFSQRYFEYATQLGDTSAKTKGSIVLLKKITNMEYKNNSKFSIQHAQKLWNDLFGKLIKLAREEKSQRAYKELVSYYLQGAKIYVSQSKNHKETSLCQKQEIELLTQDFHKALEFARESYALDCYSRKIPFYIAKILVHGPTELQNFDEAIRLLTESIESTQVKPPLEAYVLRGFINYEQHRDYDLAKQDVDTYLALKNSTQNKQYSTVTTATAYYIAGIIPHIQNPQDFRSLIAHWIPLFHTNFQAQRPGYDLTESKIADYILTKSDPTIIDRLCQEARTRMTQNRTDQESLDLCYLAHLIKSDKEGSDQETDKDLLLYAAHNNHDNAQLLLSVKPKIVPPEEVALHLHYYYVLYNKAHEHRLSPSVKPYMLKSNIALFAKQGHLIADLYKAVILVDYEAAEKPSNRSVVALLKDLFPQNIIIDAKIKLNTCYISEDICNSALFHRMEQMAQHCITHREVATLDIPQEDIGFLLAYYGGLYLHYYFNAHQNKLPEDDYFEKAIAAFSLIPNAGGKKSSAKQLFSVVEPIMQSTIKYFINNWLTQAHTQEFRAELLKQAKEQNNMLSYLKLAAIYIKENNFKIATVLLKPVIDSYNQFTFNRAQDYLIHNLLVYIKNNVKDTDTGHALFKDLALRDSIALLTNKKS